MPRLILIADRFTDPEIASRAVEAVEVGVRWVHLRDREAPAVSFDRAARRLAEALRATAPEVRISVNTRMEVALEIGAGLHLGARGPDPVRAREVLGPAACIGYSAHTAAEGRRILAKGIDYLFISPIFPTRSKPGAPALGRTGLRLFRHAVQGTPVYALGGITPERVGFCLRGGAYGVAILSGILEAPHPAYAARQYLNVLPSSC